MSGGLADYGRGASAAEQREAAKKRQTVIRRLEKEEQEILSALEKLEAEKAALEIELSRPEVYASAEKARSVKIRLDSLNAAVEEKSREWETLAGDLVQARAGTDNHRNSAQARTTW